MGTLQSLGADPICNIVAFALGADIVALLATSRHVRATLAGPVARKHFQALSIARWGEGCRCHYTVAKATETSTQEDDVGVVGDDGNTDVRSTGAMEKSVEKVVGGDNTSTSAESCTKEEGPDWLAFYLRRVGHRAVRPSPLDLLQGHYTEDAFRLLACCILCSRTSGGDTVKDAVAAFFKACPTPTSVLAADQDELRKTLLPLGLNRELIVKRFAEGFLMSPWHDPSELHGCGRFASDSWQIFCLGSYRPGDQVIAAAAATAAAAAVAADGGEPAKKKKSSNGGRRGSLDRNLAAYCRFAQRAAADGEEEATSGVAAGENESAGVRKGRAGARKAAATSLGGKRKRKRSTVSPGLESDKRAARRPRGKGASLSARDASDGASNQARPSKVRSHVTGGIAKGSQGVASTREERALRRGLRGR